MHSGRLDSDNEFKPIEKLGAKKGWLDKSKRESQSGSEEETGSEESSSSSSSSEKKPVRRKERPPTIKVINGWRYSFDEWGRKKRLGKVGVPDKIPEKPKSIMEENDDKKYGQFDFSKKKGKPLEEMYKEPSMEPERHKSRSRTPEGT